ncbi:MAG: M56 family metallopeptidase [Steroidobacteraceae bacterium]
MINQLTAFLAPTASWIWFASCKGALIILLVWALRRFATWLSPQARHGLWTAALLCLLCPVGPEINLSLDGQAAINTPAALSENSMASIIGPQSINSDSSTPSRAEVVEQIDRVGLLSSEVFLDGLMLLWTAVALALAWVLAANFYRYRRIRRHASEAHAAAHKLLDECGLQIGLHRRVVVLQTRDIDSPAVFGWWSPTLLLPLGLSQQLTAAQLRHVFLHELTHVQRHDVLFSWLAALAQVLHWFNPLVWYAVRLMRIDMERACDAAVLGHLKSEEQLAYGDTLIHLADARTGMTTRVHGLGIVESHGQLKERITMIAKFDAANSDYSWLAGVVILTTSIAALAQPGKVVNELSRNGAVSLVSTTATPMPAQLTGAAAAPIPVVASQRVEGEKRVEDDKVRGVEAVSAAKPSAASKAGIPVQTLLEAVATNIGKKFVVDPRVKADVSLYGQKLEQIDYAGLLTILKINGYTAYELNGYVNVVPIDMVRTMPIPTALLGEEYPDDQIVSTTIEIKNTCAPLLVPILRPMLPSYANLAAYTSSNMLLITADYANVKRIRETVSELDAKSPPNGRCGAG